MNDEQKEWEKQFAVNFGCREYIRLGIALLTWIFLGAAISVILNFKPIFFIFLMSIFVFAFLSRKESVYPIFRAIMGNKNLPEGPRPQSTVKTSRLPRPWYSYLPGLWGWLMVFILAYIAIKYHILNSLFATTWYPTH